MNNVKIVVFDIDETLINGQSQKFLLPYLRKKKLISGFYFTRIYAWYILYKLKLLSEPQKVMEYAFLFVKDRPIHEVYKIAEDFFNSDLKYRFYRDALQLLKEYKSRGCEIVLISNTNALIADLVGKYVGAEKVFATNLEIRNGHYTGKIKGNIMYGDYKAKVLKKYLDDGAQDPSEVCAYADHVSDYPMLTLVGNPNIVNPDVVQQKIAKKMGWNIVFFV